MTSGPQKGVTLTVYGKIVSGRAPLSREDFSCLRTAQRDRLRRAPSRNASSIPLLDRALFRQQAPKKPSPHGFVRHIGMVQDMLQPEYYVSNVNGRYTHFLDYLLTNTSHQHDNDCHNETTDRLADRQPLSEQLQERTPLVIVPLPYTTQRFRNAPLNRSNGQSSPLHRTSANNPAHTQDGTCTASADAAATDPRASADAAALREKKRTRSHQNDLPLTHKQHFSDTVLHPSNKSSRLKQQTHPRHGRGCPAQQPSNHNQPISPNDWWPVGAQGSCPSQIPILAKMYYPQYTADTAKDTFHDYTQRKLRLNDIVECIGILSDSPFDVDFSNQIPAYPDKENGDSNAGNNIDSNSTSTSALFDNDHLLNEDQIVLPPPSQLPRMHVVSFRILNLDDYRAWNGPQHDSETAEEDGDSNETRIAHPTKLPFSFSRQDAISTLSVMLQQSEIISEAILLTLLSLAQRKAVPLETESFRPTPSVSDETPKDNMPNAPTVSWECITTPYSTTLGCASLNIQLPDVAQCCIFADKVHKALSQIVPIAAYLDLPNAITVTTTGTTTTQSGGPVHSAAVPTKMIGRLLPSVFQLPKGSAIVINVGGIDLEQTVHPRQPKNEAANTEFQATARVIKQLIQSHSVPYKIQGGFYSCTFEADYRIIVVSTTFASKSVPSTMSVSIPSCANDEPNDLPNDGACKLYDYLCRQRQTYTLPMPVHHTNARYSEDVLNRAQDDFVQRRQTARTSMSRTAVTESDFHRWLTMARLEAYSRRSCHHDCSDSAMESEVVVDDVDWALALELDDAMQGTFSEA